MNKLEEFFYKKKHKCQIHKWAHYFKIYDKHFKRFINKNPTILEIGIQNGGSLEMWNNYFENKCTIYGVDIDEKCKTIPNKLGVDNVKIFIGSQDNEQFWKDFISNTPKFDIIIDDGGHTMIQQIITHKCLYDRVKDDGVYLCEDTHTSYWSSHGGGLKNGKSFIEYCKNHVDLINAYHIRENNNRKNGVNQDLLKFRKSTHSLTFYDSIVVFEKELDSEPPKSIKL